MTTIEELNPELKGLGRYEYGRADSDTAGSAAQRGLSEADAYTLLRSTAMNQNRRMVDIAQSLVTAATLLGP